MALQCLTSTIACLTAGVGSISEEIDRFFGVDGSAIMAGGWWLLRLVGWFGRTDMA